MQTGNLVLLTLTAVTGCFGAKRIPLPIASGAYTFILKFAEHPDMTGGKLDAEIRSGRIKLISKPGASVFPAGLVEEGNLQWHASSGQWIISGSEEDSAASHVGGCSDGPSVVDLEQQIYWTC